MKLRHRFIKWLSFGDMILINAEIQPNRTISPKEAGGSYLINVEFRLPDSVSALCLDETGRMYAESLLTLNPYRRWITIEQCCFMRAGRQALKGGDHG